jgi:hypothetical protein
VKVTEAFPPLPSKSPALATQSTASETLDEDTIQSAISASIKKLEVQHQAEITKLRQELRKELDSMKTQMTEMAQLVAMQTYQALTTADSPLATKVEFARLDHRQSVQENQLATIISLLQGKQPSDNITTTTMDFSDEKARNSNSHQHQSQDQYFESPITQSSSPPRNLKRTKPTLTPVKKNLCDTSFPEQNKMDSSLASITSTGNAASNNLPDDMTVTSATSNPNEDMEGCED